MRKKMEAWNKAELLNCVNDIKTVFRIKYQVSNVQYPESSIKYPVSRIKYPVSSIQKKE